MNQCRVTNHVLMTASSILRERTAQAHAALEEMPFARRLAAGEIDRISFLDYLQATKVLIASLRTDIQRHGSDLHQHLLETLDDWCTRLESDIKSLNSDDGLTNTEALGRASHQEPHSSAVNPEAGHHPVARDSALRRPALKAGFSRISG